jgi:Cysteine-rich secretory protein family
MKTKLLLFLIICLTFRFPLQAQDAVGDLFGRINALRVQQGLTPYTLHPALTAAAQSHAQWMVDTQQVSHIQDNGSSPASRAAAWDFWINSAVHYAGLTSPNFQQIGIATAQGAGGQAFVLVFGVPGGAVVNTTNTAGTGTTGTNDSAPLAPPSYVVGVDAVGNIMHELQAGQTLGDVLLTYGYTWDALPALLALNELTDDDIRALDIGAIILVPPQAGTYTPTALVEVTLAATASAAPGMTATPATGILPTPLPVRPAAEATSENGLVMPATFVVPSSTATVVATSTLAPSTTPRPAMLVSTLPIATALTQQPVNVVQIAPTHFNRLPWWLVGAIAVQVGILGLATIEFLRRKRAENL